MENITTRVIVGTTYYSPFEIRDMELMQASLECKPTGKLRLRLNGGTPPYNIKITSAPDTYTGSMTFSSSNTYLVLYDLPVGDYVFEVIDQCSLFPQTSPTVTVNKLEGTPSVTTSANSVPGSCNAVILVASFNSDVACEYAFVENASDPKVWKPCNTSTYVFNVNLPNNYGGFCQSPSSLGTFSLRYADCPSITKDYSFSTGNLCAQANIYPVNISSCTTTQMNISYNQNAGVCYPVSYSVVLKGGSTPIEEGEIENYNGVTLSGIFTVGTIYTITLQEAGFNGRLREIDWSPSSGLGQTFKANSNVCTSNDGVSEWAYYRKYCGEKNILISSSGWIKGGTKIKYVSGPDDYELEMGPVGTTVTLAENYYGSTYCPNHSSITGQYSDYYLPLPLGDYLFEVTDICGNISNCPVTVYDHELKEPFTYDLKETCNGIEITPLSGQKLITILETKKQKTKKNTNKKPFFYEKIY